MSHGKRKRKLAGGAGPEAPELNIMPFIDIFSMLNTFLLVSASFLGLGIIEVQVPFLSNSPDVKELPARSFSVKVDIDEPGITLVTQWTAAPVDKVEKTFKLNPVEIAQFHEEMIAVRTKVPENDKVDVRVEPMIEYEQLVLVLDAIKTLKETDAPLNLPVKDDDPKSRGRGNYLFEKVVLGSIIL